MKLATPTSSPRYDVSLLTPDDLHLFNEGSHYRMYDKMGARLTTSGGEQGVAFSVWAPNAREVTVMGSFNDWNPKSHPLRPRGSSGIWEGFIPAIGKGTLYKYHITSNHLGYVADKSDPFALWNEKPPRTASVAEPV